MRLIVALILAVFSFHSAKGQHMPASSKPPTFQQPDDISLFALDGKEEKFLKYRSKVTVISIWATWCAPCIAELPLVDELYRTYKDDKEVSVLAINVDFTRSKGEISPEIGDTIKENKIEMPVLMDRSGAMQEWLSTGKVKKKERPSSKERSRAAKNAEKGKPPFSSMSSSLRLPQIVIIDSKARIYRKYGYSLTTTKEEYLAEKKEIVEQARRGKLPEQKHLASHDIDFKVKRLVFMGKNDKAEMVLLDALSKDNKNTSLLYKLGHFYYDTENTEKFSNVMHRIIEIDPKHDRALNLLGYAFAEQGKDLDKAESLVRRALEIQPDNSAYMDSLGWVFYKKGNYKKAHEYLEKAASKRLGSANILGHLAETELKLGKCEKAVETYRKALKKSTEKRSFKTIMIREK